MSEIEPTKAPDVPVTDSKSERESKPDLRDVLADTLRLFGALK